MTVNVTAKSRTLANGTDNDAEPVEQNFVELYQNDSNLAAGLNDVIGTTSTNSEVDGKFLVLRTSFSGSVDSADRLGIRASRGDSADVDFRWNENLDWWEVTHNGTDFYPVSLVTSSDPVSPTEGMIWFNTSTNVLKCYDGTSVKTFATIDGLGYPKGYITGPAPIYTSAATITFPAGLKARDSGNAADIELAANVVVTLASVWTVGTPGLDAGSEASGTWYYYYLIKRPDTGVTSVIASTVNESVTGSITLPTNYTQKRQLPIAVRNDGSSAIIPFYVGGGWPHRPFIWYDVKLASNIEASPGPTNVLNNGTAASWTTINLSSVVPPISKFVRLKKEMTSGGGATAAIRKTGATHGGNEIAIATGGQHGDNTDDWETNANQQVDYLTSGSPANFDINVIGYTVTEVA